MHDFEREVMLDLARVTETAALMAARWMGKDDPIAADQAAVDGMRGMLDLVNISGVVVLGEGEKDEAPMLYNGEKVGRWNSGPKVDIAVDPLEGTSLLARGQSNALSVIVAAAHETIKPLPTYYVEKLAVGPAAKGHIDISAPVRENLRVIAAIDGKRVQDLTVAILDRERHAQLIHDVREVGCRITLIPAGDVAAGVAVALSESGIDVLYGVGGSPEALLTAAALKCLGGDMQVRLYRRDEAERVAVERQFPNTKWNRIMGINDLIKGNEIIFAATGVTDGNMLRGVHYKDKVATTESLLMRAHTGTVRFIQTRHDLELKTLRSRVQDNEISL